MAGISRLTCYEIAGNQDDILTECIQTKDSEKWVGIIRRGPGHNYKMLLSSNPVFDSKEEGKQAMDEIVSDIIKAVNKELNAT